LQGKTEEAAAGAEAPPVETAPAQKDMPA